MTTRTGRRCLDCDTDITERHGRSVRCIEHQRICELQAHNRREKEKRRRMRPKRLCLDCGTDISERNHRAVRCVDHARMFIRQEANRRDRERRRRLRPTRSRLCLDCSIDISERGVGAKRCIEHARRKERQAYRLRPVGTNSRLSRELAKARRNDPERTRCNVKGCDRASEVGGMCSAHYKRLKKGQDLGETCSRPSEGAWGTGGRRAPATSHAKHQPAICGNTAG